MQTRDQAKAARGGIGDMRISTFSAASVLVAAPSDARGWRNRGMIRLYQGGLADHDKAVQYDPADVHSWNNRGQARMRLGDKLGVIADFRKAPELRPDLQTARDGLQILGAL
jgi:regulator of sirC expression with transglutaminase-like and TPR domain